MGGYLSVYAPFIPTLAGSRIFGGVYRIPKAYTNVKGYYSNSAPVDAYRGAGRPEAAYLMERLMDAAAAQTGIDRVEIRMRNLPSPSELPYQNPWGVKYDSGDYPRLLLEGLKRADQQGFAARKAESVKHGKLRGFGFAYYVEITAAAGSEPAAIKFTENGGVELELSRRHDDGAPVTRFGVSDTGRGIRPEDRKRLFAAFEQVGDPDTRPYEGTGLGLHICQTLAPLIGGAITFESELGAGSTFCLEIREPASR